MSIKHRIKNPILRTKMERSTGVLWEMALPAPSADTYLNSIALGVGGLTIASGDWTSRTPVIPMVPVFTVTEAVTDSWTAVSISLTGRDQFGEIKTETITCTNASGTWTGTALNAYLRFDSSVITVTGTSSAADSVTVGFAQTVGLGVEIGKTDDILIATFDGYGYGTAQVAGWEAGTANLGPSTYTIHPAKTPNGTLVARFFIKPSMG